MMSIGLDPGKNGGIAVLDAAGALVLVSKMPETEKDLLDLLNDREVFGIPEYRHDHRRAILERVSASPRMGTVSAFTFGKGYGRLRMALVASNIPFNEVTPNVWQKALGVQVHSGSRDVRDAPSGKKNAHKAKAQQLFPSTKVTHAIADALLIAEYCRRLETRP